MAKLLLDNGTILSEPKAIYEKLLPLGIGLGQWAVADSCLLKADILTDLEQQKILELHESHFHFLQQQGGYLWRDLLTLHPGSGNLQLLAATYARYHTHSATEALYVLAGEIIFGFICSKGSQMQLSLTSQEFIQIPAGVEHWSSLSASLSLKAIRYFSSAEGWMPKYTRTRLHPSHEKHF
jgi:1,2-dihydroxy-3-keto-5-methylthiopentene dioxygenase